MNKFTGRFVGKLDDAVDASEDVMGVAFKTRMVIWFWNGIVAFVGGLANGALTVLGVEGTNAVVPGLVTSVTPHQFVVITLVGGVVGLALYLRTPAGKLPEITPEDL